MSFHQIQSLRDKIICALLYAGVFLPLLTWVPLLWLIYLNMRKVFVKDFVRYHCYQALLFNMLVFFFPHVFKLLIDFLANLLSLLVIFDNTISIIQILTAKLILIYYLLTQVVSVYAMIWTLRGKFTYIPPISQAVNLLLR